MRLGRQHRLGPDLLGQSRLERGEFRAGLDGVVARMRQVDGDVGLDAARTRVLGKYVKVR